MSACDGAAASVRSLKFSEISEEETVRITVDLVAAARRNLGFLKFIAESPFLHQTPAILESIRRYDQLWMPLIYELTNGSTPPMILPPVDIEWVWFCHSLNPVSYRQYCESRFSKVIGKATIFNEENEDYALNRCREIWLCRYPSEPFENECDSNVENRVSTVQEDLLDEVSKQRFLYTKFTEPYYSEIVYLIAARQRYKGFLYMVHRFADSCSKFVPTSDILLMWLTHQSYPTVYAFDTKEIEKELIKVAGTWEVAKKVEIEETKKLWERTFEQPYEKAGGTAIGKDVMVKSPIQWEVTSTDINTKYKSMLPRFLLEPKESKSPPPEFDPLCVMVKLRTKTEIVQWNMSKEFLRLRCVRCHKELKMDTPVSNFTSDTWHKAWHLYCEFGTKGMILELRSRGGRCIKGSKLTEGATFLWNDLLRAPSLSLVTELDQKVRIAASITPPVQASYLLKCVPDRVTDDSGAMISDVILKLNHYRPQEGRWLSRTVLDHAGRECFIIRLRIGGGIWRRGAETPSAVKWEDRIIEVREGCWSYVAGSIGRAPEKIVGTATPKEPPEGCHALWNFSTGNELLVQRGSSNHGSRFAFSLTNHQHPDSTQVKLVEGRKMEYEVKDGDTKEVEDENEDGFLTVVRFSEDNPTGKATGLLNWKLLTLEFSPEEDAVMLLLLCMSIVKSVTEINKEDMGSLLIRRRIKEAKLGNRDWGSVILHPSSYSPSLSSPHVQPWYWHAKAVMGLQERDKVPRQTAPLLTYSQAEGGDNLYKRGKRAFTGLAHWFSRQYLGEETRNSATAVRDYAQSGQISCAHQHLAMPAEPLSYRDLHLPEYSIELGVGDPFGRI
nr:glycine-rich domain-containing protein 1 [Ipomoea batatas]